MVFLLLNYDLSMIPAKGGEGDIGVSVHWNSYASSYIPRILIKDEPLFTYR
jgi:hypothetical protein